MNRGNRKALIFEDQRDRRRFMRLLGEATEEYHVQIVEEVLMGNHFHLMVVTPHGNLSEFMQQLEGQFAQFSNWRHHHVGHLFQGRFKGVLVENDLHLFTAFWYVATNPVEACFCRRPEDWKWSSYAATIGLAPVPSYLCIDWVGRLFPAGSIQDSQLLLRRCMEDPQPLKAYLEIAEPASTEEFRSYIAERLRALPQPARYRDLIRPPLESIFPDGKQTPELANSVAFAHRVFGYKLAEIARCVGLHPSRVSKINCSTKRRMSHSGSDPECDDGIDLELKIGR
jgi:REP element-mobilizing transposase RayT